MTRRIELSDLPPAYRRQAEAQLTANQTVKKPGSAEESTKPAKYRNTEVAIDGLHFKSKGEGARYLELKTMLDHGLIEDLQLQPTFPLSVNGVRIGTYIADFAYRRDGARVVEDWKSRITKTEIYRWKAAHLLAEYGIEVKEVGRLKVRKKRATRSPR